MIDLVTLQQERKRVCEDLHISCNNDEQDWGIINADGARAQEFIDYYRKESFINYVHSDLFELIIASCNEALQRDLYNEDLHEDFVDIVKGALKNEYLNFLCSHWANYNDYEFWPVGLLLKECLLQI